jgi:DNA-binding NtrC family response regulator
MTATWVKDVIEQAPNAADFEVTAATSAAQGEAYYRSVEPSVVLLDLMLPDGDGIDLLRRLKTIDADPEVIVVSGQGTIKRALEAGQAGAFFFLEKAELDAGGLLGILGRAAHVVEERRKLQRFEDQERRTHAFDSIVGKSKPMRDLFELVDAVAESEANILIQGENGTGKELIANAIHASSQRKDGPFIKINCAALPKDLIESELFGYKKGAFTGATGDKTGLLELSSGGSLMLDEIGEMPALLQTKLLRVLQERAFRPIGSDRLIQVDFRLICATNVDLDSALKDGRIREDLYFRINTITVRVPPLRERSEDIPLLCSHFIDQFNRRYHKSIRSVSSQAYHLLIRFRWPGNVRELENALERAVLMAKTAEIQPADLPESMRDDTASQAFTVPPHHSLAEIERLAILQTLQRTNWNKQEAAHILGLYRPTLYSKMRKHEIRDPRAARAEEA